MAASSALATRPTGYAVKVPKGYEVPDSLQKILNAETNYRRYCWARDTGHLQYMRRARLCENMYLGGGRQWDERDRIALEEAGRPALENNQVLPIINKILGYQINNRMEPRFLPKRGVQDQQKAQTIKEVVKHVLDENNFTWKETEVFADGIIQQRGYYDVRMKFDDNMNGTVDIEVIDPMDVIPDPNGKSYDPCGWREVMVTRWLTFSEVLDLYGPDAATQVESWVVDGQAPTEELEFTRNSFANNGIINEDRFYDEHGNVTLHSYANYQYFHDPDMQDKENQRVRVIDRQYKKRCAVKYLVDTNTGDMKEAPSSWTTERTRAFAAQNKLDIIKRTIDRVRWIVTAGHVILHDDWSPYDEFTIIPYFAYFRRGKTISIVDNLISPQQQLNKMTSQAMHVTNTSANSGWLVEEQSLGEGMTTEDLEMQGAKTGIVIPYRRGATKPEKIQPNRVPTALEKIIERTEASMPMISGVNAGQSGTDSGRMAGYAIKMKQGNESLQVGGPLDNLALTRKMVAERVLKYVQQFYTQPQVLTIHGSDPVTGDPTMQALPLNQPQDDGSILNDLSEGTFATVIDSVPSQATGDAAEFAQMMEMKDLGIMIPDDEIILASNLKRKAEIAQRVKTTQANTPDPKTADLQLKQAEAELENLQAKTKEALARVDKIRSEGARAMATVNENSTKTAERLAVAPHLGPIADLLRGTALRGAPPTDDSTATPPGPTVPTGGMRAGQVGARVSGNATGDTDEEAPGPSANGEPPIDFDPQSQDQGNNVGDQGGLQPGDGSPDQP